MELLSKKCNKCYQDKPLTQFYIRPVTEEIRQPCRSCITRRHGQWVKDNREKARKHSRESHARCQPRVKAYRKAYYARNIDKAKASAKRTKQIVKDAAYAAYGGYRCNCCGETDYRFLSLDHVNNDGGEHRRKLSGTRNKGVGGIYDWLKKHKYPPGIIQVLCMNCNYGKRMNHGVCPHQEV